MEESRQGRRGAGLESHSLGARRTHALPPEGGAGGLLPRPFPAVPFWDSKCVLAPGSDKLGWLESEDEGASVGKENGQGGGLKMKEGETVHL